VKRILFSSRPFWFTKVAVRTCFCLTQFSFKCSNIWYLTVGIVVVIYVCTSWDVCFLHCFICRPQITVHGVGR
jgi:hypothetical protein